VCVSFGLAPIAWEEMLFKSRRTIPPRYVSPIAPVNTCRTWRASLRFGAYPAAPAARSK